MKSRDPTNDNSTSACRLRRFVVRALSKEEREETVWHYIHKIEIVALSFEAIVTVVQIVRARRNGKFRVVAVA